MTKRKIQYWVIPPKTNAEFVASMEEVLETYAQPYDKRYPVVCMDEQPVQLLQETRVPVPATKMHARRVDYEYELGHREHLHVLRTAFWLREVHASAADESDCWAGNGRTRGRRYADADKVILVCDNLNTHTKGRLRSL